MIFVFYKKTVGRQFLIKEKTYFLEVYLPGSKKGERRATKMRKSIKGFLSALVLVFLLSFSPSVLASNPLDCRKEKIEQILIKFILAPDEVESKVKVSLVETKNVLLGDIEFCEVIYLIDDPQVDPRLKKVKFVAYLRDNLFLSGDVRVLENNRVRHLGHERFLELNRSVFEELRQQGMHGNEREKKLADVEFFEKVSDITLGSSKEEANYDIYVMIDPRCPHCVRVVEYFDEKLSERKDLRVNYIVIPALGPESRNIVVSVLCDIKEPRERIKKLKEKYVSSSNCAQGREKAEDNFALFIDLGFRGVPVSIIYKKDESGKFVLLDVVNGANIPLLERLIN